MSARKREVSDEDISSLLGVEVKPKKVKIRKAEEQKDPIEQLLADRGYIMLDKVYGRVGRETVPIVVIARDPFGQIHYVCTFPMSGKLCGAEFYSLLDIVRHMYLVHERNLSEMQHLVDMLVKEIKEGRISLDLAKSVLPQELMNKIERKLT